MRGNRRVKADGDNGNVTRKGRSVTNDGQHVVWELRPGEPYYPTSLGRTGPTLYGIGDKSILMETRVGLLCSEREQAASAALLKVAAEISGTGDSIVGTWRTACGRDVIEKLLQGPGPGCVVICVPKDPARGRLNRLLRSALGQHRGVIVSLGGPGTTRASAKRVQRTEALVAELASAVLLSGPPDKLLRGVLRAAAERQQPMFVPMCPDDAALKGLHVRQYESNDLRGLAHRYERDLQLRRGELDTDQDLWRQPQSHEPLPRWLTELGKTVWVKLSPYRDRCLERLKTWHKQPDSEQRAGHVLEASRLENLNPAERAALLVAVAELSNLPNPIRPENHQFWFGAKAGMSEDERTKKANASAWAAFTLLVRGVLEEVCRLPTELSSSGESAAPSVRWTHGDPPKTFNQTILGLLDDFLSKETPHGDLSNPDFISRSGRVKLYGDPKRIVLVDGKSKALTRAQYKVVATLIKACQNLTKDRLIKESGSGDAINTLKSLAKSDLDWEAVIFLPGQAKKGSGYGIL